MEDSRLYAMLLGIDFPWQIRRVQVGQDIGAYRSTKPGEIQSNPLASGEILLGRIRWGIGLA